MMQSFSTTTWRARGSRKKGLNTAWNPTANATLPEYHATTSGRNTYNNLSLMWNTTKVLTTGRAKITVTPKMKKHIDLYLQHLRPLLQWSNLQFTNREGKTLDHLSRYIAKPAKDFWINLPENATETRHAGAKAAVERTGVERRGIATAMSHSRRTQLFYYVAKQGEKDAVKGYTILKSMYIARQHSKTLQTTRVYVVYITCQLRLLYQIIN